MAALDKEDPVSGRSRFFTVPKKEKDSAKLAQMSKKISKKEKRIQYLAKSVKKTYEDQEKIQQKKKEFKENIKIAQGRIEEEHQAPSVAQVTQKVEQL